jgi:hypothetical protein
VLASSNHQSWWLISHHELNVSSSKDECACGSVQHGAANQMLVWASVFKVSVKLVVPTVPKLALNWWPNRVPLRSNSHKGGHVNTCSTEQQLWFFDSKMCGTCRLPAIVLACLALSHLEPV